MNTHRILRIGALAAVLSAAPLAYSPEGGLAVQTACGQNELASAGTCCTAESSVCIIDAVRVNFAYAKPWYDLGACG
jgi:hypothetical protein